MFFYKISGIAGAATAPAEKFAQKDEPEQRLAENQKMLQELQGSESGRTPSQGSSGISGARGTSISAGANIRGANSGQGHSGSSQSASDEPLRYADPDLTNGAPVSTHNVMMIGDSIMLDSSPQIKEQLPDCYIDAVQSRQLADSADLAQYLVNEGYLDQTVVISLGTNGPIQEEDARRILNVFDPDISIFWVNLYGRTVTWEKESNHLLKALQRDYPNLSVNDWCSLIRQHKKEWLWEDGEHPNPEGSEAYAILIRESLETAAKNAAASSETH